MRPYSAPAPCWSDGRRPESPHQLVTSDYTEFERAGHTQKIVPMASNEVGVDAMASHAIEGSRSERLD